jgi:tellurite resistance protein TehA-like permease
MNMGTGITSILLYNFPSPAEWLLTVGTVIFVLNVVISLLLAAGNIVRYITFSGVFAATLRHPVAGLIWGTLPMGFATIVGCQICSGDQEF